MGLKFQNSTVLFLIVVIIPVIFFINTRIKKYTILFSSPINKNSSKSTNFQKRIKLRTFFWCLAWIFAIIALSGPSWGTKQVEVYKSGTSATFVFDISYSMLAEDAKLADTFNLGSSSKDAVTRLKASEMFTLQLLQNLSGTAVSGVLAKGEGVLAIPLTEDYYALENLVNALSPNLVSAPGSSISKGIETAITAFPPQSAHTAIVVVCTDGDETDSALNQAVQKAVSYGIQVVIVGFGSVNESKIIAGDGKTFVNTALRENLLMQVAEKTASCQYFSASSPSTFKNVLQILNNGNNNFATNSKVVTSFKTVSVERHILFLVLSLICLVVGFIFSELNSDFFLLKHKSDSQHKMNSSSKSIFFLLIVCTVLPFLETGCTGSVNDAATVLKGRFKWQQHDYDTSNAIFLSVINDAKLRKDIMLEQYGIYGLAATYLMQNEKDAALSRLKTISPMASKDILFHTWYTTGIIQHRMGNYDLAATAFKNALRLDGSNIEAKINYELSLKDTKKTVPAKSQSLTGVNDSQSLSKKADSVFSVIKENEDQKWKNSQQAQKNTDIIDY